ncbi:hypothetical protein TNCV_2732831 [Trichonephila clavipes]|nr:hypothetical protein TNCV_2732831 [Trichonephila clavipes]
MLAIEIKTSHKEIRVMKAEQINNAFRGEISNAFVHCDWKNTVCCWDGKRFHESSVNNLCVVPFLDVFSLFSPFLAGRAAVGGRCRCLSEATDRSRTCTLPHNGKRPVVPLDAPRTSEMHTEKSTPSADPPMRRVG